MNENEEELFDIKLPKHFTPDQEFLNPDLNYRILLIEMRERIENIQQDMKVIKDPEILGFTYKRYIELKNQYFNLLKSDLELQSRFGIQGVLAQNLHQEVTKNE